MTDMSATQPTNGVPTYLGRGDPAGRFADYYPAWVDKLAGDVTLEGSMLDGPLPAPDAIRAVIGAVCELYDCQDFNFAGPCGENSFIEDYITPEEMKHYIEARRAPRRRRAQPRPRRAPARRLALGPPRRGRARQPAADRLLRPRARDVDHVTGGADVGNASEPYHPRVRGRLR